MSEQPVTLHFPLLKLPFLCILAVIRNVGIRDLVLFSYISKRTRRLVKCTKSRVTSIEFCLEKLQCIVLKPLEIQWTFEDVNDETFADLSYLTSLFECSVDTVRIDGDYLPENKINFNFTKLKKLFISGTKEIDNNKLKHLVEHFEVSDLLRLEIPISNTFYCNPKLFKTEIFEVMGEKSAGWITGDFLSQLSFDKIHRFAFNRPQFTIEDVVSVVTEWFCERAPSLKSFVVILNEPIQNVELSHKMFKLIPFNPERRPKGVLNTRGEEIDFSNDLDIVRSDGQLATIQAEENYYIFHVWSESERRGEPTEMG